MDTFVVDNTMHFYIMIEYENHENGLNTQGICVVARVNKVMSPKGCVLLKPFSSLVAVIIGIERTIIFC